MRRISNGQGRTTCSFFYPDARHVLYASTYLGGAACPPKPDFSHGYVWPVYRDYDIFKANPDGSGITRLTSTPGYDAEATISRDGHIVFTSVRDGDMEIYSMAGDGTDVKRLTHRPGPDGGPFFSPDATQIVFRGHPLPPGPELNDYLALLRDGLWRPTSLEIFVMNADGSNVRQVTSLGGANFAPVFHARRQADHLRLEQGRPEGPRLRAVPGERGRQRPGADHVQPDLRRLPDVLARRQEAGVRVEPARREAGGHERVHRELEGVATQETCHGVSRPPAS